MKMFLNFSCGERVLFLGEGNFSFSASLIRQLMEEGELKSGANVTVTCYEARDESNTEIRAENLEFLEAADCRVHFQVDAKNLHNDDRICNNRYDRVVFMFPHVGGKMKIKLNRELLAATFTSVAHILASGGHYILTLCKGQGGTPFDTVQRSKDDTWKVLELAQDAAFILTQIFLFPASQFQDYSQVGYRSLQKSFHVEDAVVHVLRVGPVLSLSPLTRLAPKPNEDMVTSRTAEVEPEESMMLYPLTHVHHISFWCPENTVRTIDEADVEAVARQLLRPHHITTRVGLLGTYSHPNRRRAQTYQISYISHKHPLGPKKAYELHYNLLGQSLVNVLGVTLR